MKILFDLFPVIIFFILFNFSERHAATAQAFLQNNFSAIISGGSVTTGQAPILLATVCTIIATVLQIGYLLIRRKKVDGMLWLSFFIVLILRFLICHLKHLVFQTH